MKGSTILRERWRRHKVIGEAILVLALAIVGGWLRFKGLGRDSLWSDEAVSALQAHLPFRDLLWAVAGDVHPPLFHLMLYGVRTVSDSEWALRLPSAFLGALSIPFLYLLGRTWFSGSVGGLAALMLAMSPLHVMHSQDARMYTMLTLEGILSWYLFSQLLKAQRRSSWVGYLLVSESILYTHYYGALLLLPQTGLVVLLRNRGEVERVFWSRWLVAQACLALLFLPWVAFAGPHPPRGQLRGFEPIGPHLVRLAGGFAGLSAVPEGTTWLRAIPILVLAMASLVRDESQKWRPPQAAVSEQGMLLCLGYLAVPIAVMLTIPSGHPLYTRYMLMTAPAFFLLVSVGLSRLLPDRLRIGRAAIVVMLSLPGLMHYLSNPRTPDYRGMATLISTYARPGDVVLFNSWDNVAPFQYYYPRSKDPRSVRWCPQWLPDARFLKIPDCLSNASRVWVVASPAMPLRKEPAFMAVLAGQFHPVRIDHLFLVHVALFERS